MPFMRVHFSQSILLSRAMILVLYVPLFNYIFFALAVINSSRFNNVELFTEKFSITLALFIWSSSVLCLLFAKIYELIVRHAQGSTLAFIIKYTICAIIAGMCGFQIIIWSGFVPASGQPEAPIVPLMIVLIEVMLISALRFIFYQNQRHLILENNFKQVQFRALKAQLNPHMLFNTLNLISSEISHNPDNAERILDELSELLRGVLKGSGQVLQPISEEIKLTEHYLFIQKMRFEERLNYQINVDENCLEVLVPTMILQPFVENCIVHGFAGKKAAGLINITMVRREHKIIIKIVDNGDGFDSETAVQGYGVNIARDTLDLLYADNETLLIESHIGKGTTVTLNLPISL